MLHKHPLHFESNRTGGSSAVKSKSFTDGRDSKQSKDLLEKNNASSSYGLLGADNERSFASIVKT